MMDSRIKERLRNFQSSNTNIQKHREERSLMLRKEKLLENIMNKRLSSIGAKLIDRTGDTSIVDYSANNDGKDVMDDGGILDFDKNMEFYYTNLDSTKIPDEDLEYFESLKDKEQRLNTLKDFLRRGDCISSSNPHGYSYNSFAVYHIKHTFYKIFKSVSLRNVMIDEELCMLILNEFLKTQDLSKMMTYCSEKLVEILLEESTLNNMIELTSIDSMKIKEHIVIILGNILIDRKNFILENTNYSSVINQMLVNEQNLMVKGANSTLRKLLLWNITTIIMGLANQELTQFEYLIPILKSYLKKENLRVLKLYDKNQEEISIMLNLFGNLSNNDSIIESMISNYLIDDFVYLLQYLNIAYSKDLKYDPRDMIILTQNNLLHVLKIINNIFCGSDESLLQNKVLNSDFIEIVENLLLRYRFYHKEDKKVVSEMIWVLSNVMAGPSQHSHVILSTIIPKNLFRFYGNKEDVVVKELLIFFEQGMMKGGKFAIVEILKLNFIKYLFDTIKSYDNNKIILTCLSCISMLISFSKEVYNQIEDKSFNGIRNEFRNHSIITRLEQLAIHNNQEINSISQKLLEEVEIMMKEDEIMN